MRLLLQLHAVLKENLEDLRSFLGADALNDKSALVFALRKLVELVYGRGFQVRRARASQQRAHSRRLLQDPQDHADVNEIIKRCLPLPADAATQEIELEINSGSSRLIQIGSVYCLKPRSAEAPPTPALFHSEETIEQLELLAASMQSKVRERAPPADDAAFKCPRVASDAAVGANRVAKDGAGPRARGADGQRFCGDPVQSRVRRRGLYWTG